MEDAIDVLISLVETARYSEAEVVLETLVAARVEPGNPLRALALVRAAQELGRADVALQWLLEAHRTHPESEELAAALCALREDLGETQDENEIRTQEADSSSLPRDPLLEPQPADITRFIHLFAGREDHHARQWCGENGHTGYSPIKAPLTPALLVAHLHGSATLGVYVLRIDDTVTFFALDLDIRRKTLEAADGHPHRIDHLRKLVSDVGLDLLRRAAELGIPLLLEDSGFKGRHLWGFLEQPLPAELVHRFGRALLAVLHPEAQELGLEFFPKQGRLNEGLGNLVKLPLGIHLGSGRRSRILNPSGTPTDDPWGSLRTVKKLSRESLLDALSSLRDAPRPASPREVSGKAKTGRPSESTQSGERSFEVSHFSENPELRALLGGCVVLRTLVGRALNRRRLLHDERVVIAHTMGHLSLGVDAVNFLFRRCPEVPEREQLNHRHRGNPISCPRIRKRIPETTAVLDCHCSFADGLSHYPTPLLHKPTEQPTDETPFHLLPISKEEQRALLDVGPNAEDALVAALAVLPGRTLETHDGIWSLAAVDGTLVWTPRDRKERS